MYGLDILQQCGKTCKTKSQKALRANFYLWRSCREKNGRASKQKVDRVITAQKMKFSIKDFFSKCD